MVFNVIHDRRTGKPVWFDIYTGEFKEGLRKESIAYPWVSYKHVADTWSWITDLFDLYYEHILLRSNFYTQAKRSQLPEEYNNYELRRVKGIIGGLDMMPVIFGMPVMSSCNDEPILIYEEDSLVLV